MLQSRTGCYFIATFFSSLKLAQISKAFSRIEIQQIKRKILHLANLYWIFSTHNKHASMNAATHGTDIALPAAFAEADGAMSSMFNFGEPEALAWAAVVGKHCEANISADVRHRRCTFQGCFFLTQSWFSPKTFHCIELSCMFQILLFLNTCTLLQSLAELVVRVGK